jgi:CYTH domain-containing protein
MKNKEIERKFLINELDLPDLSLLSYMDITQGYLPDMCNSYTYRLRHVLHYSCDKSVVGEEYFQTIKGKGTKMRPEYEINMMYQQFHELWPLCSEVTIHKHRYIINSLNDPTEHYYLDIYKNGVLGLYTVEVEFKTLEECNSFIPPDWFGVELTEDSRFSNYSLAMNGFYDIIGNGYMWKCVDCEKEFFKKPKHICVNGVKNNSPKFLFIPSNLKPDIDLNKGFRALE